MTILTVNTRSELIIQISKTSLYSSLVHQLQKDFTLIGLEIDITKFENPLELFNYLKEIVSNLLQNNFNDFLNLLYRIDIPEEKITQIIRNENLDIEFQISFLILKREWQKVWFKTFY